MSARSLLNVIAALLLSCCIVMPAALRAASPEVDTVVNKANTITELSLPDAKKIFMGDKTTWPDGRRITVLMLTAGQPERAVVLQNVYKMSDGDYSKYFLQAAFTGKVTAPPKEIASPAELKRMVADNPGAVGYLKKEDVDDSVKVVLKLQ